MILFLKVNASERGQGELHKSKVIQRGKFNSKVVFFLVTHCSLKKVERLLFQRAECNLNFDLHKFVFCFQIYKGIQISEHSRMKPKKLSTQGCFK